MSAAENVLAVELRKATNVVSIRKQPTRPKVRPGTTGYKWTAAQRKKHAATCARKAVARLKERAKERRSKAERLEDGKDALGASLSRNTAAPKPRRGKPGPEERLDAIVYLTRAYAAYEGIPDEALLGLLALRTLQGRIK